MDSSSQVSATGADQTLQDSLQRLVDKGPAVLQAVVIAEDGTISASVLASGCSPPKSDALQNLLQDLTTAYPRPPLKRMIMEDAQGTVVAAPIDAGRLLLVVTEPNARLGSVFLNVERFVKGRETG